MSLSCLLISHYPFIPSSALGCGCVWFSQLIPLVPAWPSFSIPSHLPCCWLGSASASASGIKEYQVLPFACLTVFLFFAELCWITCCQIRADVAPCWCFLHIFISLASKKLYQQMTRAERWSWQFLWAVSEQGTDSFARTARSPLLSLEKFPNRFTKHNVCLNAEQHRVGSWIRCSYQRAHSPVWESSDPPDTLVSCCPALFPASILRKLVRYAWLFASTFIMELFSTFIYFLLQYHLSQSLPLMAFSFSVAENDICSWHTVVTAQLKMSWGYWWHGLFLWRASFNFIMGEKHRVPITQQLH